MEVLLFLGVSGTDASGGTDGVLDEVEHAVEVVDGHAGGARADEPVEHQAEEVGEDRDRHVTADDARFPLPRQALLRGASYGFLALGPALGELGIRAQLAADLQLYAE